MNKKGFTLVELLAVLVLIILIMMLIVPSLQNLSSNNKNREYTTYEDMMVEYTKTISNYKNRTYVCLNELNMQSIAEGITCNGYVKINNLKPYLSCTNKNRELVYKTEGYNLPSDC